MAAARSVAVAHAASVHNCTAAASFMLVCEKPKSTPTSLGMPPAFAIESWLSRDLRHNLSGARHIHQQMVRARGRA